MQTLKLPLVRAITSYKKEKWPWHIDLLYYHIEAHGEEPPLDWYERTYSTLIEMSKNLSYVDLVDGKLINSEDDSIIRVHSIWQQMVQFKSLTRAFLGAPLVQDNLKKMGGPCFCFSKVKEREPVVLRSLTKICEYLNVSPQHRRVVRFTLCRQITHQHIWRSTLQELLKELKLDIDAIETPKHRIEIGKQIISCCSKFLNDSESSFGLDSPSWMRLTTTKKPDSPIHKWGDVLEMFNDLTSCLKKEQRLALHVLKLEAMKEGLYQIKDVFLDRDIGYKRARQQECLVQKKLSQSLGHSSECLFTLLLYNLYGRVRNIEVDLCGGVCNSGGDVCLSIGKVSSATDMKMITRGIRHLDKALGLFKFVWEVAGMKKGLHLRGHIWNVGGEERVLQYRGNTFFVHGIKFPRRENFNYEY